MKKISYYLFLLLFLFTTKLIFGQTLIDLDQKKGFKDFVLGDPKEKWKNYISYYNQTYVQYTGECCQNVFNYEVSKILLQFNNDKLVEIIICIENLGKSGEYYRGVIAYNQFNNIVAQFASLFGNYTDFQKYPDDGKSPDFSYFWSATKVQLSASIYYQGITKGYEPVIVVKDLEFLKQKIKSGF